MKTMAGKRVPDNDGDLLNPGEYARISGTWHACTPNGYTANIGGHKVIENGDGTITVAPSILVRNGEGRELWHGHLENGLWKEC